MDEFVGGSIGAGKKSLAITVRLQPRERTLTDEQIDAGRQGDCREGFEIHGWPCCGHRGKGNGKTVCPKPSKTCSSDHGDGDLRSMMVALSVMIKEARLLVFPVGMLKRL